MSTLAEPGSVAVVMATFNDWQGVQFTLMHALMQAATELQQPLETVVVDNWPGLQKQGCPITRAFCTKTGTRYIHAPERIGTAAPRDLAIRSAKAEIVICLDSHVLLQPGALTALVRHYQDAAHHKDMVQGPLLNEQLEIIATHWNPVWNDHMFGTWATFKNQFLKNTPFEIPMMGLGMFCVRKPFWPGFNPHMTGFGGEEGYLHAKVRQQGGRSVCLPAAGWWHRFAKPQGIKYPNVFADRIFNYLVGWHELGLPLQPIVTHFAGLPGDLNNALQRAAALGIRKPEPVAETVPSRAFVIKKPLTPRPAVEAPMIVRKTEITCLCPTFNRLGIPDQQVLLEEAVEAFLKQTYTSSKLLILNDHPRQVLLPFKHPRIQIINTGQRFVSLGDKHNALFSLAESELVAMWDDDDISLPHRLEMSLDLLGNADYLNPRRHWYWNQGKLHHDHHHGVCFNCSLVRRSALRRIGMAPPTAASDMEMDCSLSASPQVVRAIVDKDLPPSRWWYIYRWGVSQNHVSGVADIDGNYARNVHRPVPSGSFEITPRWRTDYCKMVADYLRENNLP